MGIRWWIGSVSTALVLVPLVGGGALIGQGPEPKATFRAQTDLIPVDVSVLDANRRPLRGLTAADFTVLENGQARPIVAFSAVEIPRARQAGAGLAGAPVWAMELAPEIVSNDVPAEGRMVAILFDQIGR